MSSHASIQLHLLPFSDRFTHDLMTLRQELFVRAIRLTKNTSRAEDLVQDAIERALRFRQQFTPGTSLRSWVQTIVFSLFITSYRRHRRERDALRWLGTDPCAWTTPDMCLTEQNTWNFSPAFQQALESLPEPFRVVLLLIDVADWSYREVAEELQVPIGTVMSRLHRARRQLAEVLGKENVQEQWAMMP